MGVKFVVAISLLVTGANLGAQEPVEETVVSIQDFAFGPAEVRIKAGETVRWINEDIVPHTVTSDAGLFNSGFFGTGEGYSRRFDEPGEYPYHCTPHPFMVATVIVEPLSPEDEGDETEGARPPHPGSEKRSPDRD